MTDAQRIRALRSEGASIASIARQLGISRRTVRQALPEWQATVQTIQDLRLEGRSAEEIAEEVGLSPDQVSAVLRTRKGADDTAARMWDLGHAVPDISRSTGLSHRQVLGALRRAGRITTMEEEVARLRAQMLTAWEIAQRLGVSERYVQMLEYQLRREGRMEPAAPHQRVTDMQVAEAHSRGLSLREMARELGVSVNTIRYHLRRLGLVANTPIPRLGETRARALELHQEGVPPREIAKRLGVSRQRIYQILGREPDPDLAAQVRAMRDQGTSWRDIARELGVHPTRAWWLYVRGS